MSHMDPQYDTSRLTLKARTNSYALFQDVRNPQEGRVNRWHDWEWEIFEKGSYADMSSLYHQLTAAAEVVADLESLAPLEPVPVPVDPYTSNPRYGRF